MMEIVPPSRQTIPPFYDEMLAVNRVKVWPLLCKILPSVLGEDSPKASPENRIETFNQRFANTSSWAFYGRFMDLAKWRELGLDIVVWHLRKEYPNHFTPEWHDLQVLLHAYPDGNYPSLYQIMVHHRMTSFLAEMKKRLPHMWVYPDTGESMNIRKLKVRRIIELYIQYTERTPVFFPSWNKLRTLCKQHSISCHRKNYSDLYSLLMRTLDRVPTSEDFENLPKESKPKAKPIPFKTLRENCKKLRDNSIVKISLNSKYEELLEYYYKYSVL